MPIILNVLILVLMEYALRVKAIAIRTDKHGVLILVLMEYALRVIRKYQIASWSK